MRCDIFNTPNKDSCNGSTNNDKLQTDAALSLFLFFQDIPQEITVTVPQKQQPALNSKN